MPDFKSSMEITMPRGIGVFWSWWTGELSALLPESLLQLLLGGQHLVVELEDDALLLSRRSSGKLESVGSIPLEAGLKTSAELALARSARSLVFCLPKGLALVRSLTLPLATEENLHEVLAFEMDRKTPYRVEQVYYDSVVESRDHDRGTIQLKLILAPRDRIDPLLKRLDNLGLHPDRLTLRGHSSDDYLSANLLPAGRRPRRTATPQRVNRFLIAIILLLLAAAVSLPILEKQRMIDTLQPQLDRLGQEAVAARKMRTKVESVAAESRFLAEKKQSSLLILEVLNEMTQLLPDDTWINQFELEGDEVHVRGQSQASAVLISLVESSPLLHNARFRSPVTQNRKTNMERFHLSADVEREDSP